MKDLVEVATFMFPNEADVLVSLLQGEGITYYLDESNIIPGVDVRLLVPDEEVSRAIQAIKDGGFENYLTNSL